MRCSTADHAVAGDVGRAPRFEPFDPTNRSRQIAGATVVMLGALPVAIIAASRYGRPPNLHVVLLSIGITATLGWLVYGRRYIGAGSASLALGLAFTVARETSLDEYGLVFGFLGVALLLISRVNPRALGGSAGLLIYVSSSAFGFHEAGRTVTPRRGSSCS